MTSVQYPPIDLIWHEKDPLTLKCCLCDERIAPEALVRTFRLKLPEEDKYSHLYTRKIDLPTETLLLYDRHLGCLQDHVPYVTVSHVWHRQIGSANYGGRSARLSQETTALTYQLPVEIYKSLISNLDERPEMWHDYISVPQWSEKSRILLAIPQIYKGATFTLVHLEDVTNASIERLDSETPEDRLRGVTSICNAQWFRRMWTAMEMIRSSEVRIMLANNRMAPGTVDSLFNKMHEVWDNEVTRLGGAFSVEQRAQVPHNLVPWMLGPLAQMRRLKTAVFGHAFTILSARQCSQPHDFFYGLLGLLPTVLDEDDLEADSRKACSQIARLCLEAEDYSPLLMIHRDEERHSHYAFSDVSSWGLGWQTSGPLLTNGLLVRPDHLLFRGEMIGRISHCEILPWQITWSTKRTLAAFFDVALAHCGPHIDNFVPTVGTRLFGQDTEEILERITDLGHLNRLQELLVERSGSRNQADDEHSSEQVNFIADCLGLSNHTLRKGINRTQTPVKFLRSRGGTMHGVKIHVFVATCSVCHKKSLYRAALQKPPSDLVGAIAYRVPGLRYEWTLMDGVGFVVLDGCIVGRVIWACPACPCRPIGEVQLQYPDLPMPKPNSFKYGSK